MTPGQATKTGTIIADNACMDGEDQTFSMIGAAHGQTSLTIEIVNAKQNMLRNAKEFLQLLNPE